MKKIAIIIGLIITLFVLTSCENNRIEHGDVHGYVRDYEYKELAGAIVTISGKSTITNQNGYYYISDLIADKTHTIKTEKSGYINSEVNVYISPDKISSKNIYLIEKNSTGSISGNITISSTPTTNKYLNKLSSTVDTGDISNIKPDLHQSKNSPKYVEDEVLVRFKSGITAQYIENQTAGSIASISKKGVYKIKAANSSMTTEELYNYYQQRSDVASVSYNHIGQLALIPDDTFVNASEYDTPLQWNIYNTNLPLAWDKETGSSGVTVAVIDTGYLPHPDLDNNLDTSIDYDFVGDDIDDPSDDDTDAYDQDSYYTSDYDYLVSHGTHVAGIIGAVGNNNLGIAGVNWDVKIMPIRIFKYVGIQYFEEDDLIDAIYYAVDNGADVINLSLVFANSTTALDHPYLEQALQDAYNQGVTVVAAAGNDGKNDVYYPASSQYTIAVGASTIDNQLTDYSNYGYTLDIIAPGGDTGDLDNNGNSDMILSTHNYSNKMEDKYLFMAGTSMAAPMVSGVAALLNAQGITDPGTIKNIIKNSASPIDPGLDAGLLNAYAALNYNSGNPYTEARIMAAVREDDSYYVMSTISGADTYGNYNLNYVQTGLDLEVIGWIDKNNDDIINSGDYFGVYENTVNLYQGESINGINFGLSYVYSEMTANNNIKVKFSPPPLK